MTIKQVKIINKDAVKKIITKLCQKDQDKVKEMID